MSICFLRNKKKFITLRSYQLIVINSKGLSSEKELKTKGEEPKSKKYTLNTTQTDNERNLTKEPFQKSP